MSLFNGLIYVSAWSAGVEIFRDCEGTPLVDGFESGDTAASSSTVP